MQGVQENQQGDDSKMKQASDDTLILWPGGTVESYMKQLLEANVGIREVTGGKGSFHLPLSASTEYILAPIFKKSKVGFCSLISVLTLSLLFTIRITSCSIN